ncbi:hypothetical protein EB796_021959 [Bugula neritina]|uniref:Uncharacterized protein n=1 Tax=Bugula neritina TaxID=10212 RepID=A0A7J7J224_BUGNE|nr:hypothetical protein EB796_021959 [Bugula neritina]
MRQNFILLHLCPCSIKRWIRDYFAVSEIFLYVFLNSTSKDSSFTYLLFFPHSPPACYQQKKLACFKFGINQLIYLSAKALVSSWFLTCPHIYYIVNEMRSTDISSIGGDLRPPFEGVFEEVVRGYEIKTLEALRLIR